MTSIRILHLEDSSLDGELIRSWLARGVIPFTLDRVDSRQAFLSALQGCKYDLVLADYALPDFDGLRALEIVTQQCPDVPFLFVSGVLGEEVAINTLQRGATDYVLKQRLDRLVPAVVQALAEARERVEHKQAEEALRRSEQQLRQLADAMPQIVWAAKLVGRFCKPSRQSHRTDYKSVLREETS
jgi:DNA-binding NtrC family response regulator